MNDATTLVVPLWAAVAAGITIMGMVVSVVVWSYSVFQRKEDAVEESARLRNEIMRLDADLVSTKNSNEIRMDRVDEKLGRVAEDVGFIRGMLENKLP